MLWTAPSMKRRLLSIEFRQLVSEGSMEISRGQHVLSDQMIGSHSYSSAVDRPALAAALDIRTASNNSRSPRKLLSDLSRLKEVVDP